MKNKKVTLGFTILALALIVFAGIKLIPNSNKDSQSDTNAQKKSNLPITYVNASYAYGYSDFNELTDKSALIAVVKFTGIKEEKQIGSMPKTIYNATIEQSVVNSKNEKNIAVNFTGGSIGTQRFVVADDPLPNVGDEYLIFARLNDDGSYTPLSGSQGRYDYKDGSISSLNYTHSSVREASIDMHNKNFDDLKTKIQAHKKDNKVKIN